MPKDGDFVTLQGEINVFPPKGNYQLIVRLLQLEGLGDLLLKFQEQKNKLAALGWFDPLHKKKIPAFPKTIGVITSPTGAVIQDIIHVLNRRHKGFHLLLNPVLVQGAGAKEQIAKAIQDFNTYRLADVLIVGRGGGSLEDLWAFNEEIVAEAIYQSKIPVISAVGHETDFSIADFVADIRAPTPSAAAEIAACDKNAEILKLQVFQKRVVFWMTTLLKNLKTHLFSIQKRPEMTAASKLFKDKYLRVDQLEEKVQQSLFYALREKRSLCSQIGKRLFSLSPLQKVGLHKKMLLSAQERFKNQNPEGEVLEVRKQLVSLEKNLALAFLKEIAQKKERLQHMSAYLSSIDPKTLLKKGYALVFKQKTLLSSIKQTHVKDALKILLHDGAILAETQEIIPHE